jgi:hypothetical protein
MTTKPPIWNILQGIPSIEDKSKQNQWENGKCLTTGEEKATSQRVALINLHTITSLHNKMAGTTTYQYQHWISMYSTPPSKHTAWESGLKRKIWQSVVYKRLILLTEINTGFRWKARRRFTKLMAPENRQESQQLYETK